MFLKVLQLTYCCHYKDKCCWQNGKHPFCPFEKWVQQHRQDAIWRLRLVVKIMMLAVVFVTCVYAFCVLPNLALMGLYNESVEDFPSVYLFRGSPETFAVTNNPPLRFSDISLPLVGVGYTQAQGALLLFVTHCIKFGEFLNKVNEQNASVLFWRVAPPMFFGESTLS